MSDDRARHDIGKNKGQGLANVNDTQRRDLAGSGDRAPTQDQAGRPTSGERGAHESAERDGDRDAR
ncbi:MAG: hypothetical protein ACOY9B_12185 [Pseudomonadota bacterium]